MNISVSKVGPIFLLIILFSLNQLSARQLSGNYTIGTDYATITDAVADLNAQGISDEVIFTLKPGIYDEQVLLGDFTRHGNPDDLVVFDGQGTATWQYSAPSGGLTHILALASNYIRFQGIEWLGYKHTDGSPQSPIIFEPIAGGQTGITFDNNIFDAGGDLIKTEWDSSIDILDLTVTNNEFRNGSGGVILRWNIGCCVTPIRDEIHISGNEFLDVGAGISSNSDNGILLGRATNVTISENTFSSNNANTDAMRLLEVEGFEISRNNIDLSGSGSKGISISDPDDGEILNNFVTAPTGISVIGNLPAYEIDIRHNTIRGTLGISSGTQTNVNVSVLNNIVISGSTALFAGWLSPSGAPTGFVVDRNNYYNGGNPSLIVQTTTLGSTSFDDLASWQDSAGNVSLDEKSSSVAVNFENPTSNNLRLIGSSIGDGYLATSGSALTDIDGVSRNNGLAYKGASEASISLTQLNNASTALGYYQINPVGGGPDDFDSVREALDNLHHRGISGDVTFRAIPGTFGTIGSTYKWRSFKRPFGQDDLIVKLESLTSTMAVINEKLLIMSGVNGIDISGIEFLTQGIEFQFGSGEESSIQHCLFNLSSIRLGTLGSVLINSNTFMGGSRGINYLSTPFSGTSDFQITNNEFINQSEFAISINGRNKSTIDGNTIKSNVGTAKGILIADVTAAKIEGNSIHLTGTGFESIGIEIQGSSGTTNDPFRIVNNSVVVGTLGISQTGGDGFEIYHNSVVVDDDSFSPSAAFYQVDGKESEVKNNIFENAAGGFSMIIQSPTNVDFDYNNQYNYVSNPLLSFNGTGYANLSTYQGATGQGPESVSQLISYVNLSNGDLHLIPPSEGDIDLAGDPEIGVLYDFDGDLRGDLYPYMGFDEADQLGPNFDLDLKIFLAGPYNSGSMTTGLNANGILDAEALDHPYSDPPWNVASFPSVSPGFFAAHPDVVDWVFVSTHTGNPSSSLGNAGFAMGLLMSDGSVKNHLDGTSLLNISHVPGEYYIQVRHRNHLAVVSSVKVDFSSGSANYDFSDALAKAHSNGGQAMRDMGDGNFAMWGGDGDSNNGVTAFDFISVWLPGNGGPPSYSRADFDMNGTVTAFDFLNVWLPANGQSSQTP